MTAMGKIFNKYRYKLVRKVQISLQSHAGMGPLTQCVSILQSLVGPPLLYQLDSTNGQLLLGGLGVCRSMGGSSTEKSMQRGELHAWMSVAEIMTASSSFKMTADALFLSCLDWNLSTQAFWCLPQVKHLWQISPLVRLCYSRTSIAPVTPMSLVGYLTSTVSFKLLWVLR